MADFNLSIDLSKFKQLEKDIEEYDIELKKSIKSGLNELTLRTLRAVKLKTSVGKYKLMRYKTKDKIVEYNKGRVGGILRNSWTTTNISEVGNEMSVELFNPIEYVEYYEYGHRQKPGRFVPQIGVRLKKDWVEGRFPLTKSVNEIENKINSIMQKHLRRIK